MVVSIYENYETLAGALVTLLVSAYYSSVESNGVFNIAISGGSLPLILQQDIVQTSLWENPSIDFTKWNVFLVDERLVPLDHKDSNHKAIASMTEKIPRSNIYGSEELNPEKAASKYQELLKEKIQKRRNGFPVFDLILLGMGPDGHTASLFPNHLVLKSCEWVSFVTDSPKPPSERITLTLPVINSADHVAFVVSGGEKAEMVKSVLVDGSKEVPAGLVAPTEGKIDWYLERLAALQVAEEL